MQTRRERNVQVSFSGNNSREPRAVKHKELLDILAEIIAHDLLRKNDDEKKRG